MELSKVHNITPVFIGPHLAGGIQAVFRFDNDYGASVIKTEHSYGVELAVIEFTGGGHDDYKITYDTSVADDVMGWIQDETELFALLMQIQGLTRPGQVQDKNVKHLSIEQPPVYDTANLRCCITCVIAQENGDTSGLDDNQLETWQNGITATDALNGGWEWSGVQCDSFNEYGDHCDCDGGNEEHVREGWFSWSPCEFCGDTDGGQRFNVAIMKRLA